MADLVFLKLMKLDAMCLGNHEFDEGPGTLSKFIKEVKNQFPILSANISTAGEPLLAGKITPYTIKKFGSKKVAIIGLTTIDTPDISNPGKKITFSDPLETVKVIVTELTRKDIDIILVISHLGFMKDLKLAKSAPGIDIIIGGHTHTMMGHYENFPEFSSELDYPCTVQNPQKEPVLIVQSWEKAKILGVLKVGFDNRGKMIWYSGHPVILTGNTPEDFKQKNVKGKKEPASAETFKTITETIKKTPVLEMIVEDKEARTLLDRFSRPIDKLKETVIGKSEIDLFHVRESGQEHETAGVLKDGSLIAPVVADALLWKAKSIKNKNTQIVLQNAGNVRCDILEGDITINKIYELLPYENTLVLLDLKGAELKEVLKGAIIRGSGAFPYTSGLRYTVDLNKKYDSFFTCVEVKKNGAWTQLEDNETYHIAVNNFIASGKDGYTILERVKDKEDTGFVTSEIFMEFVRMSKTLKYSENRVTINR